MKKSFMILIILIILLAITLISSVIITAKPAKAREWEYTMMGAQVNYSIGERVTSSGRVYECRKWDGGSPLVIFPPEANPDWWTEVQ